MAVVGCAETSENSSRSPNPVSEVSEQLKLYDSPLPMREIFVRAGVPPTPARTARPTRRLDAVDIAARRYDIDPGFLRALIKAESRANPRAVSPKGAVGLMQVMPATGRLYGASPSQLLDPGVNLGVGARYLKTLQRRYGNNLPLILAAYNAGEGAVDRRGRRIPPYRETVGYVVRVLDNYQTNLMQPAH